MEYVLKQIDPGNHSPLLISLHEDEMKIGRSTVTSLSKYNKVSRYHATFTKQNDSWFVTDLKSLNCLYVNEQRIQHTVQLNIGDIIGFGTPNVSSQDGGFVCFLLANPSKVIVKVEPSDDDCVEIPTNSNINIASTNPSINEPSIVEDISGQHIYNVTDESNMSYICSRTENLRSISSEQPDLKAYKTESCFDLHLSVKVNSKVQAYTVQPTMNCPANNTKKEDNLNCIESGSVSEPRELIHVNPVSNTSGITNTKVEYDNASSGEIIEPKHDAHNLAHPICTNTPYSLVTVSPTALAYPGIEYLEGLEEFRSCGSIDINEKFKNTDLEKCKDSYTSALSNFNNVQDSNVKASYLNSPNVKQDYPEDFITDLDANIKVKTEKLESVPDTSKDCIKPIHSATFQKCKSIGDLDVKKSIPSTYNQLLEHLPKGCTRSFFDQTDSIHLPNDLVQSGKSCDSIQSLNTNTFSDKTVEVNNATNNILSSHHHCNSTENVKNKGYSKEITDSTKSLTKQRTHHTLKQNPSRFQIDNEVNPTKKTHESNDSLPTITQDCSIQLKRDSKNTQISLKARETSSSYICTDNFYESSSESPRVNNSTEVLTKMKSTTYQAKRNNLTVAINLKVRKNKILSSESECDEEDKIVFPSSKSSPKRRTEQNNEKHHRDNHASERSQTKKSKTGEYSPSKEIEKPNKAPIATPFVHSKRRYSWSDSDEYYRSRSPPVNENRLQEPKSLKRTLLIDFKPMEYRSRKLRGREEWFQERTGATNVKTVRSSRNTKKSYRKSYETANSAIECSKKGKQKICCQKRKENKESKYSVQKSEENYHKKQKVSSHKIEEENSQKNTEKDSVVKKRSMPPVPRRKINFCSRMGFLLDKQVNCDDIKLINNDKQREELKVKQGSAKHQEIMSSESELQLDLSLELGLSADKKQTRTYKTKPVKPNTMKTTRYEPQRSVIAVQHPISKVSKVPTNKHESEKWVPVLELNSKGKYGEQGNACEESSLSDTFSDSNILKTKRETFQHKDITDSSNSKKKDFVSPNHQITKDSTKCCRSARTIKKIQISSTVLTEMIVSWNPKWLLEQKNNKKPPPLIAQGASCLNLSFSSYESYASSYFPMIVLEVWECLFKECSQHLVFEQLKNCNNFSYTIKTWDDRRGLTDLKCESIVSDTLSYHPTEGKIVLLNVKERQEGELENYTFGYIQRHSIEEFKRGAPEWDHIPNEALSNAKLVKFEVVVKKSKRPSQLKPVYLAHGLSNIKQKLLMADALRSFRNSPICENIYHPREETLMFCDSSREALSWNNLNQAISGEIQNPMSKAQVMLLQTPPGTGKTKCVVELVKKLTSVNSKKVKVLVCSPSYTSLNELFCGLVQSNESCSNSSSANLMKLVRIGEDVGMSGNMKEYSLTRKVERLYKEDCVKKMHSREVSLKFLEEKINDILFKQQTSQDMYTKINKCTTLKALVDKMQSMKEKNLLHRMDDGFRKGYECIILQESDVLLSTIDCSTLPAVRTFLKGESAAYCIVDKAAQCNELQLLQCLHHEKIEKLILFGDPQQQKPTTISRCAAKFGFGRSIFERFFLHFKKKFHKIPCPTFKKQYRMHSQICQFPSKYFYNQELSTAAGTDERYANFPLKPYVVLDVLDPGPIPDDTGSSLIMYICSLLVLACPTATVGVILVGEGQKNGLSLPSDPEYSTVEINTLEEFRGKEKDIVLIPCIPQSSMLEEESIISCGEMLNEALTSAKQCLIICGQISSLQFPHWRALKEDASARNCYLCVASVTHIPLLFANYIKKA